MAQLAIAAPAGAGDPIILPRGDTVMLRPAVPADAAALQDYFRRLSARARYQRLMGAVSELPAAQLDRFVRGDLDAVSLVAITRTNGGQKMVAEARYAFDRDTGRIELALSVADEMQRRGLGTALLSDLESRAAALGARHLFGDTLRSNDAMIALARRAGFALSRVPGDWTQIRFEKPVAMASATPLGGRRALEAA